MRQQKPLLCSRQPTQGDRLSHSLVSGQLLAGRFRIPRFISSNGMGEVFEAWDSELGEMVALKTGRPETPPPIKNRISFRSYHNRRSDLCH